MHVYLKYKKIFSSPSIRMTGNRINFGDKKVKKKQLLQQKQKNI